MSGFFPTGPSPKPDTAPGHPGLRVPSSRLAAPARLSAGLAPGGQSDALVLIYPSSFVDDERTEMTPEELGTILGVWAHPDDEAFLSGGLMAAASDGGQTVAMVTATLGEAGTADPQVWPPDRLRRIRRWELRASSAVLGVGNHRLLGYGDGTLEEVDPREGAGRVREAMEETAPDTILTFGPEGMTGHADHKAVSAWTTMAWRDAGRPGRLLYATQPVGYTQQMRELDQRFSIFFAGQPPETPEEEMAIKFELPPHLLDRKVVALRAQASQTTPIVQEIGVDAFGVWLSTEHFVGAD